MVKYEIFCRCLHPTTGKVVTNATNQKYENLKYIKGYAETEAAIQANDVIQENSPSNEKYNMLFMYNGVKTINNNINKRIYYSTDGRCTLTINDDDFIQMNADPWILYASRLSLESATRIAKELVKKIGLENVKVTKMVPLKTLIDIG